ncbi:hypothetical protein I2I11_16365 [Pontibacter sp. 172403-2]|uniref:hypothetical protein n=1 Tax=Pontibacter rufus TaxID=2791028 RepID=UPI0018AF5DC0|nr:hypothetical protein [Pontibacter sp. 172403-2]MBF9254878.1 hypothetical protein [Pontibacter sp. 172403-2]
MKELKRLVKLVAEQSGKASPLITQQEEDSFEKKLFDAINEGAVTTDEEAAAYIYGSANLSASYRMLKSRLRKKVLNSFIFLEQAHPNKFKICAHEISECGIMLHQARKLSNSGEYKAAQKLTEQILLISISAELTEFTIKALEYQRDVCLLIHDKPKYAYLSVELQKYYLQETAERKAEMLFYTAKMELSGKATSRNKYLPQIITVLKELGALWEQTNASKIFNFYHSLTITWLELTGNYEGIFGAIEEAEKLLEQGKLNPKWYNARFNNFIKTYAYIRTNQYELGLAFAQEHWTDYNPKSFNWFAFMENYMQLAIYSRKYKLAVELMKQVKDNNYFNSLSRNKQERWELHRRYLLLCYAAIKEEAPGFLKKEICAIKILSADKEGANLAIIVFDLVDSLLKKKYDVLENQPELISKYISRNLKGNKAERVRVFLRLLLLVVKEDGNFRQIKVKSKLLLEKLSAATKPDDIFAELEIVPYEHLWEQVYDGLLRK